MSMTPRYGLIFLAALIAQGGAHRPTFAAPQEAGAEADLPKAETILDGYIEATGGKKAYEKLRTRVVKGKVSFPALKAEGTIATYQMAPDKLYSVVEIGGVDPTEQGVNGKVAWERTR